MLIPKPSVERWKTESKKYLNQEFLANGDCAVQLDVVGFGGMEMDRALIS